MLRHTFILCVWKHHNRFAVVVAIFRCRVRILYLYVNIAQSHSPLFIIRETRAPQNARVARGYSTMTSQPPPTVIKQDQ